MAEKTDISPAAADRAVKAVIEIIFDTLKKEDPLTLPGFGTFEVRERPDRSCPKPIIVR
jgi:DNA-binding protein HU-beta